MRENHVLPASFRTSQILVYNERNGHLQLAKKTAGQAFNCLPINALLVLFFREDLSEPHSKPVSIHRSEVWGRMNLSSLI